MLRDKHKRKKRHVVLVTSDSTDSGVKQFHIKSQTLWILIVILCVLIGILLGYIAYEERIWTAVDARNDDQQMKIAQLQAQNDAMLAEKLKLETEVAGLQETVQLLSETVNQKTEKENELQDLLYKQSLPTEFPLGGSATVEEVEEASPEDEDSQKELICVFTTAKGTPVLATARGTVIGVNDDVVYGHNVWIDHGNGYVTIYRNAAEPQVDYGDTVSVGTVLFVIKRNKDKLGYQMMKDGAYIDPMEMLAIHG